MSRKIQNPKTNAMAYLIGLLAVCALILVFTGKATLTEAGAFLGASGTLVAAIGLGASKDAENNNNNP